MVLKRVRSNVEVVSRNRNFDVDNTNMLSLFLAT